MRQLDRAVGAQELFHLLYERGDAVGLASVYRALDELVAAGEAERIRRDADDAYVLCPARHHHHAICRDCGRTDVLEQCSLQHADLPATSQGFHIDTHQTVFYGRCSQCFGSGPGGDT